MKETSRNNSKDFESVMGKATQKNLAHQAVYSWAGNQFTGGLIADIGSELGFGLRLLNREDRKIIGLDINFDVLVFSKIRFNNQENILHFCADSGKIPMADNSCTGVCLVNVLYLAPSPCNVLNECWRILLVDHPLVITIPTDYNLPDEWRVPTEKIFLERLIKRVFTILSFPQMINGDDGVSQKTNHAEHGAGLLTAICVKT